MIYEWQAPVWEQLTADLTRLPHALLFSGPPGCGKQRFAEAFAARLLCERAAEGHFACGKCVGCTWFAGGNHPDFCLIVPQAESDTQHVEAGDEEARSGSAQSKPRKPSKQIRIEQVRGLLDYTGVGSHRQGRRVIVIRPAEAMTAATSNALLKILEEPTSSTHFILISNSPSQLLATVRSRCRSLTFRKPSREQASRWLKTQGMREPDLTLSLCGGMPVAAAEFERSGVAEFWEQFVADVAAAKDMEPLRAASRWEAWVRGAKGSKCSPDAGELVAWLQKWVFDLTLFKMRGKAQYHPGMEARLQLIGKDAAISSLLACYNDLTRARAVAEHPLNTRLFLEDLTLRYIRTISR